jgi:uncharacterized protein (UPF0147 family)
MDRLATFRFVVATARGWGHRTQGALSALSVVCVGIPFVLEGRLSLLGGVLVALLGAAVHLIIRQRHAVHVDVGLDGLHVRHRTGEVRERFVPFRALSNLRAHGNVLTIEARGILPRQCWYAFVGFDAFCARVAEAQRLAAAKATTSTVPVEPEAYRSAAYPNDVLLRVVEDATQSGDVRVAAADALRTLDADERERVRVAAATTASTEVRQALDELAMETEVPRRALTAPRPPGR